MRKREKCENIDFCIIFIKNALFAFLPPKTIKNVVLRSYFRVRHISSQKAHIFMKSMIFAKKFDFR